LRQRVDPFIPVRGQAAAIVRRPVEAPRVRKVIRVHHSLPHTYETTIDGFIRSSPVSYQPQPVEAAAPASPWKQSVKLADSNIFQDVIQAKPAKLITARQLLQASQTPAIAASAVGIGLLAPSLSVGEAAIGAYGLFAVVRGVASRTTFLLALVMLSVIIAALGLQGSDSEIGQNFAVYAFLLLAVGTISLGIEARKEYA
jgi:hypothetical protein